jgi:predicted hotdog family 3-hydroxylacyl-ACP dehydratase
MLDRAAILRLIPHQGAMCLLDRVAGWTARAIDCTAVSHLAPDNPLRRNGRLGAVACIEYGLQAACLHGALTGGGAQPAGYLAALRDVRLRCDRLDDPAIGALLVHAALELHQAGGMIYRFSVAAAPPAAAAAAAADGAVLLDGRASILLPDATTRLRAGPAPRHNEA